ncbi:MAG TPA: RagB/SusD family nutrient uptake outer membrane protein [Cyclobacteriaceae bacterium]|nr:RagB/SusD family nutrient uptake outer membrane protein [Cyclobacteriaceae bacterium]
MNKNKFITAGLLSACLLGTISCKDQLDVGNPNAPTIAANVNTEAGIYQLATGGTYVNGFYNGDDWLGNSYFSLPMGYNELMADNVGASASNNQVTTIGQPDYILYPNGTKKTVPSPSIGILRTYNTRAATGASNNAIHYQWLNMYALNNAMNLVLSVVDEIPFGGDAATKAATVKAWAYFWKGFAYSSVGTKYYSGLIINEYGEKSSTYVTHDAMIAESDKYFTMAATTLDAAKSASDYEEALANLIPDQTETGRGGVMSVAEWKRNINSMLARNILLNKLAPFVNNNPNAAITGSSMSGVMTAADWTKVRDLAAAGIREDDLIFTGRTTGANDFFSATGGTVASLSATAAATSTFKISERALQNFKPGDKRFANNFRQGGTAPLVPADRYVNDYVYSTRYTVVSGGNGAAGVWVYANRNTGAHELVIASSWEETALMEAEARIRLNDINAGLALIDDVRDFMGAGVAHVANTGLSLAGALNEVVMERRTSLLFRGITFYDNRRWGWTYDVSKGGGAYNQVVVDGGAPITGVLINYNFMDYWDVPAAEAVLNPDEGSVGVKNPNF